jgi:SOS-response transcriptional repressor LexA
LAENTDISDRLSELAKVYAGGNKTRFAQMLGTSEANIRNYIDNGKLPKFDFIKKVCETFEISYEWLISGIGEMEKKRREYGNNLGSSDIDDNSRRIPIIDIEAAAGNGTLNIDHMEILGYVTIPECMLQSHTATYYAIRSRGDSMFPIILDKDMLIVRVLDREEWQNIRDKHNYPNFTIEAGNLHFVLYPELRLSPHLPNINTTYASRLKDLEDRIDEIDIWRKRIEG